MADKKATGADSMAGGESAAKRSAPKKGARSAGDPTPPGTGRATKAAGATAETAATGKSASRAKGAVSKAGAGKGSAGGGKKTTRAGGTKGTADLKKDLRDFAGARPDGWSHDDWLQFLDDLKSRGHNVNDRDAIGSMLERERLALALERIPGVGPQRVRNIADRYGYLWRLRETDADQLSREANVPRPVAEKVVEALGS